MKFSVGLLSWKRVLNIRQIVDKYIFHDDLIDEIIIWNNNPEEHIEFGDGYDIVKVINCQNPEDFGLITRFCMGSLSKNPMIILQDDDFILPYESLVKLRDGWLNEPNCFHTFFGRNPNSEGEYADKVIEGNAEICGRCYTIDRKLCGLVLHEYYNLNEEERQLIHSKGDDILASYVLTHYTGKLHQIHQIPHIPLDESYALSYGKGRPIRPIELENLEDMEEWFNQRTIMMNFCKRRYQ
tara:strand:- start:1562 stop:2281 length:720 start_codon:yes stop_codon:yes gene_type:complete